MATCLSSPGPLLLELLIPSPFNSFRRPLLQRAVLAQTSQDGYQEEGRFLQLSCPTTNLLIEILLIRRRRTIIRRSFRVGEPKRNHMPILMCLCLGVSAGYHCTPDTGRLSPTSPATSRTFTNSNAVLVKPILHKTCTKFRNNINAIP